MMDPTPNPPYVHGYHAAESARLGAQALSIRELLHGDVWYPTRSLVFEPACGTGEQTLQLAANNPGARFMAFDRSRPSLDEARARVAAAGLKNVEFREGDIYDAPFSDETFDHAFVCFLLEHVTRPVEALRCI